MSIEVCRDLVTLSILHTKDIYTTHFSTNDLSHVLSTGTTNTLPVHIGWDLTYQAAYCITPGACTNLPYAAERAVHSSV